MDFRINCCKSIPNNQIERIELIDLLLIEIEKNEDSSDFDINELNSLSQKYWNYYLKNRRNLDKEEREQFFFLLLKIDFNLQNLQEKKSNNEILKKKG